MVKSARKSAGLSGPQQFPQRISPPILHLLILQPEEKRNVSKTYMCMSLVLVSSLHYGVVYASRPCSKGRFLCIAGDPETSSTRCSLKVEEKSTCIGMWMGLPHSSFREEWLDIPQINFSGKFPYILVKKDLNSLSSSTYVQE